MKFISITLVIVIVSAVIWLKNSSDIFYQGQWVALNPYSLEKNEVEISEKKIKAKNLSLFCFNLGLDKKIHIRKECLNLKIEQNLNLECALQNIKDEKWIPEIITVNPAVYLEELRNIRQQFKCSKLLIDVENLKADDREQFSQWVQDFATLIKKHELFDQLSVAVHAKVQKKSTYSGANAHDIASLCLSSDNILLMAYDKHIPPYTGPGPVAPLDWVLETIKYTLKLCPSNKIRLGLAAYGYDWKTGKLVHEKGHVSDGKLIFIEDIHARSEKIEQAKKLGIKSFFTWSYGMY